MKVRMAVQMSGTRDGEPWPDRGEVVDLPAAEATALLAAGIAEPAKAPAPENASVEAPENATAPKSKAR